MHAFTLFAVATAALVSGQTALQNYTAAALAAQIPACVLPCDDAAIKSVGCGLTEYACHCAHGAQLAQIIPACLKSNATDCSASDLALFASIPPKICAALNSTTPAATGTAASVGTIPPSSGTGAGAVNSTVTSTKKASSTAAGPSTVTSTNVESATGTYAATNVPTGPSTTSSAPLPSKTNDAAVNGATTGLLGLLGVAFVGFAL